MIKIKSFQEENFWDIYPDLKYVQPFKDVYTSIRARNDSSAVVWAIYLLEDPKSPFSNESKEQRNMHVRKDYLGKKAHFLDKESAIMLRGKWKELCTTPEQRALTVWRKKLEERTQLLEDTPYTLEVAKELDSILKSMVSFWDQYETVYARWEQSEETGRVEGGIMESASDKGLI